MSLSFRSIKPLLHTGTNTVSRWLSFVGLSIGVLLLLCSIQMFINIQQLLGGNVIHKNGYDYISVSKRVTNETMDDPDKNVFRPNEIEELKKQPFIDGVSPLIANEFHVQLGAAGLLKTDLFLETLENEFIDTVPPSFHWEEGQNTVPVIMSSDFLEVYNVFAPGQGLPQISSTSAMNIPITINCYGKGRTQSFIGYIVAFTDRVSSVLVPKTFMDWANASFGEIKNAGPSRVFIKTKDANNADLIKFLDDKNYNVNREKTKFGREKRIMQGILSGLGIFGLLVVLMAFMLFSFYLQLVIARSKENLQLLLLLGYSPSWLSKYVSRQFVPVYILIVLAALGATQALQWGFHHYIMYDRPELTTIVHWSVIVVAIVLILLAIVTNYRLVRKLLFKLY